MHRFDRILARGSGDVPSGVAELFADGCSGFLRRTPPSRRAGMGIATRGALPIRSRALSLMLEFPLFSVAQANVWIYPCDLQGLWMSLTMGVPGFPPTWTFSRNSLIADVIFASLLLAVWVAARAGESPRRVAVVAS